MAYNRKQIIDALIENRGLIFLAAKSVGCTPQTIYNVAKKSAAVQDAIDTARGELTDRAESALVKAIERGEGWAICFYLKTQGKSRGYIERQEISGPDGTPIPVKQFVSVSPDDWDKPENVTSPG